MTRDLRMRPGPWAMRGAFTVLVGLFMGSGTAVAAVKVPVFEQGRGVLLAERPTYIDAPRNIAPGSISQRDGWGQISWTSWGGAVASGTATYHWHTQGDIVAYPSTIRLESPRRCGRDQVYTQIVGSFTGAPPPDLPDGVSSPVLRFQCAPVESAQAGPRTYVANCANTYYLELKPNSWSNGCTGGALNIVGVRWGSYSAQRATGTGRANLRLPCGTNPTCPQAGTYRASARLLMRAPRRCGNGSAASARYFSRVRLRILYRRRNPFGHRPGWKTYRFSVRAFEGTCQYAP